MPELPLPPTTTTQEDLTVAGQRKVNLVWEYTQAFLAIIVVCTTMAGSLYLLVKRPETQIPTILSTGFGLIVGFYFARTNHANIGGVGPKPTPKYEGR